jgi:hypothetical protein
LLVGAVWDLEIQNRTAWREGASRMHSEATHIPQLKLERSVAHVCRRRRGAFTLRRVCEPRRTPLRKVFPIEAMREDLGAGFKKC